MNEFSLIDMYFKKKTLTREDVITGIGDDAACVQLMADHQLVVTTDTLVNNVHFLLEWGAYVIGWRAVMVSISDIAAMGASPCWASLALTLPDPDEIWIAEFSKGLHDALNQYGVSLIGGDTTKGPLTITLTIHGQVQNNRAFLRKNAQVGDSIWVSGPLGGAAAALLINAYPQLAVEERQQLMQKLLRPEPRFDLRPLLYESVTAAIDISDGLVADLNHICQSSGLGACLSLGSIPIHPVVRHYFDNALDLALYGGDDYELCFTASSDNDELFLSSHLNLYRIGIIEEKSGLRARTSDNQLTKLTVKGYQHF